MRGRIAKKINQLSARLNIPKRQLKKHWQELPWWQRHSSRLEMEADVLKLKLGRAQPKQIMGM